jgi:hypothetical protein
MQVRRERVKSPFRRARRTQEPASEATLQPAFLGAGNRAVAGLLSTRTLHRAMGWTDAVTTGEAWNKKERLVGNVWRIPLEGLAEGMQTDKAKRWKSDKTKKGGGYYYDETTDVAGLSTESAKGKAIVLLPAKLDAKQKIEVVIFLHGWTEGTHRPYAGWRTLVLPRAKPSTKKKSKRELAEEDS